MCPRNRKLRAKNCWLYNNKAGTLVYDAFIILGVWYSLSDGSLSRWLLETLSNVSQSFANGVKVLSLSLGAS